MESIVEPEIVFNKIIGFIAGKATFSINFSVEPKMTPEMSEAIYASTLRDYLPVANKPCHFVYCKQRCQQMFTSREFVCWHQGCNVDVIFIQTVVPSTLNSINPSKLIIDPRNLVSVHLVLQVIGYQTKLCFDASFVWNLLCSHTVCYSTLQTWTIY